MKKGIPYFILLGIILLIMLFPYRTSDLYIRIEFNPDSVEITEEPFYLYYELDGEDFKGDAYLESKNNPEKSEVVFRIPSEYKNHLSGIRIDFPPRNMLYEVKSVSVLSAGMVKKRFLPNKFFADANVVAKNDINEIDLVPSRLRAYISTGSADPYIVLGQELTSKIEGCYSVYMLTRILLCAFACLCFFSLKKGMFPYKKEGDEVK